MCWTMVTRNRRRYRAVMAAIAFGTAGFIMVRTMGDATEQKIGENLELLGEATVIRAYWDNYENYHPGRFYMKDVYRVRKIPHVAAAAPVVTLGSITMQFNTVEMTPRLVGVDQAYWKTQTATLAAGRLIGPSDVALKKVVCVLGKDLAKNVFGTENPVGKKILVANTSIEIIGVLGGLQKDDIARSIFVPLSAAQAYFPGLDRIEEIYIRADNWDQVENVRNQAFEVLKSLHKGYEEGLEVMHFPERVSKVTGTVSMIKLFVYAALAIAFLLGKVGLTSVMLAAVQERTKEIGLRKALGAEEELLMLQFLTESVFISVAAGLMGVFAGIVGVNLIKGPVGIQVSSYVLSLSIFMDLGLTMLIGVVAGVFPALQAGRMDPVTAMRFE
jgi:putative ABC transport system permease protein